VLHGCSVVEKQVNVVSRGLITMESSTSDSSNTYAPSYSNRDPGMNVPGKTCFVRYTMSTFACSVVENACLSLHYNTHKVFVIKNDCGKL
jgi:hypothetical protein